RPEAVVAGGLGVADRRGDAIELRRDAEPSVDLHGGEPTRRPRAPRSGGCRPRRGVQRSWRDLLHTGRWRPIKSRTYCTRRARNTICAGRADPSAANGGKRRCAWSTRRARSGRPSRPMARRRAMRELWTAWDRLADRAPWLRRTLAVAGPALAILLLQVAFF